MSFGGWSTSGASHWFFGSATFTDPDAASDGIFTVDINFHDGNDQGGQPVSPGVPFLLDNHYSSAGPHSVTVTVTDHDGTAQGTLNFTLP